jgi:hypothetical protein
MQKADVVLSAIRKRGTDRKPLQRVYRQLFNRELYFWTVPSFRAELTINSG